MTEIPKGCKMSLCIKEVIEEVITHQLHIDLKSFNINDYDRSELNKIIHLANQLYDKNPNKTIPEILWDDFYQWYQDYRT